MYYDEDLKRINLYSYDVVDLVGNAASKDESLVG